MNAADLNLSAALPALSLAMGACVLFLVDAFIPKDKKAITVWLAALGIVVSFVLSLGGFSVHTTAFNGMFLADPFSAMVNVITLIAALLGIMVAYSYLKRTGIARGEDYPLLLITASGAMFMASAGDLAVIFVGLGMLSIPLYILAGVRRPEARAE